MNNAITNNAFWENYWANKTNGEHRSQDEEFLKKEAEEKLFHLAGGDALFDFGCGSADLLSFYAPFYSVCVGADRSASMLKSARLRLAEYGLSDKVRLLLADDSQVWELIEKQYGYDYLFDRITAGQVIQYFNEQQIDRFISHALSHLSANGRICLFDIIDSRTLELWQTGLFMQDSLKASLLWKLYAKRLRVIKNKLQRKPKYDFGNIYPPTLFHKLAKKYSLDISIAHSMYYEYRYHVILSKK